MAVSEVQLKELVKRVEYLERGLHRLETAMEPLVAPASEVSREGPSEKEGWGSEIRGLLLGHIRQKAHNFPKERIIFRYVGKKDRCHTIALVTYRGKRKPDKKVTGGELLRSC